MTRIQAGSTAKRRKKSNDEEEFRMQCSAVQRIAYTRYFLLEYLSRPAWTCSGRQSNSRPTTRDVVMVGCSPCSERCWISCGYRKGREFIASHAAAYGGGVVEETDRLACRNVRRFSLRAATTRRAHHPEHAG